MKKILLSLPLVLAGNFSTTINQNYILDSTGAAVEETITITNQTDQLFPTGYSYRINSDQITNLSVNGSGNPTPKYQRTNQQGTTKLDLYFSQAQVGKTKSQAYVLNYHHPQIKPISTYAQYHIPQPIIPDQDTKITTNVVIPKSVCPNPRIYPKQIQLSITDTHSTASYNPKTLNQSVTVSCQPFRYLQLSVTYPLTNPSMTPIETQITLPPDTSYQRLIFDSITPQPLRLNPDADGNRIATFKLEPKENLTVTLKARAIITNPDQIYPSSAPDIKNLTQARPLWPTTKKAYQDLAKQHSDLESIYHSIVTNPQITPEQATDVFITLARIKNIASRKIDGVIQSDQLIPHQYADWYDPNTSTWHPIDPGLEKTQPTYSYWPISAQTHLALAIHGHSDTVPYPLDSTQLTLTDTDSFDLPTPTISATNQSGKLVITNNSSFALINLPLTLTAESGETTTFTLDRLDLNSQRIIPATISLTSAKLESAYGPIPINSGKNPIHSGLTLASILAGTAGGIAVFSRRLLVSRPKR